MLVKIEQEGGVKSIKIAEASDGLNAYQLAVKNDGFVGDYDAWKLSLKGDAGYTPVKDVDYFDGADGNDANVTSDNIDAALGYTPADDAVVGKRANTIADLKTLTALNTDAGVELLGYYAKGDGGGGSFYWDATSTEADNGGTVIKVTAVTTGRWKKIIKNFVTPEDFGENGTGEGIQKAIDYVGDNYGLTLKSFSNQYTTNRIISITKPCKIYLPVYIVQSSGSNLPYVVDVNITANDTNRFADINIGVDADRANNTTLQAIRVFSFQRDFAKLVTTTRRADIGVLITNNVERSKLEHYGEDCRIGVKVSNEGLNTPDENDLLIAFINCDTFFEVDCSNKSSGYVRFACEVGHSWSINLKNFAFYILSGEIRGGSQGSGGGLRLGTNCRVSGSPMLLSQGTGTNTRPFLSEGNNWFDLNLRVNRNYDSPAYIQQAQADSEIAIKSDDGIKIDLVVGDDAMANIEKIKVTGYYKSLTLNKVSKSTFFLNTLDSLTVNSLAVQNNINCPGINAFGLIKAFSGIQNTVLFRGYTLKSNMDDNFHNGVSFEYVPEIGQGVYCNGTFLVRRDGVILDPITETPQFGLATMNASSAVFVSAIDTLNNNVIVDLMPSNPLGAAKYYYLEKRTDGFRIRTDTAPLVDVNFDWVIKIK